MPDRTLPDFSRLGERQIDALTNVAFGGKGFGVERRMLQTLEGKGFIYRVEQMRSDRFGSYSSWPEWYMPLPIHIAFCAFCATLPEPSDDQEA